MKWIFGIILCILLILLFFLLLVILIPVRYRAKGEYNQEEKWFCARIDWFFHLIDVHLHYRERLELKIKVFGVTLYDLARSKISNSGSFQPPPAAFQKIKKKETESSASAKKTLPSSSTGFEDGSRSESVPPPASKPSSDTEEKEKKSLLDRIRKIRERALYLFVRIKQISQNVRSKTDQLYYYYQLWEREDTQRLWSRVRKGLKKIFLSLLPRKWELCAKAGFEDPSTTGQMMAWLGMSYPFHQGRLKISPDFELPVMELKGYVKGRIILGILFFHLFWILANKDALQLIHLFLDENPKSRS